MSTFNTKRFATYANFDLTINKNFYRNMSLVLILTIIGVVIISFFMRWLTYQISAPSLVYNDLTLTAWVVIVIMQFSFYIAAGCTLHPLRNKQGRITHLTIPATNLEKYLWHVVLCIVGCFLTAVVAVALADLVNYLMTLMVFKETEGVQSLFVNVFTNNTSSIISQFTSSVHASMNGVPMDPTYAPPAEPFLERIANASIIVTWCSIFCVTAIYAFANTVMYKFNLPVTYLILKAIEFCFAILIFIGMIWFTSNVDKVEQLGEESIRTFFENFHIYLYVYGGFAVLAGIGFWAWAYNRYTKAQLINRFFRK